MTEYRDKVEEEYQPEADTNAEESWKLFKKVVMRAAEEVCGTTKGGKHLERETWWWTEEVQESMRRKKDAFKKWHMQGGNELKEAYKNTKRERHKLQLPKLKTRHTKGGMTRWEQRKVSG